MNERAFIVVEDFAGMRSQAAGLTERAGLPWDLGAVKPSGVWSRIPARFWPSPLAAVGSLDPGEAGLFVSVGGLGGRVASALRRRHGGKLVQVQNPRLPLGRFDLIVANRHDEISGPNVISVRNALHGVTPEVLARAKVVWRERLAGARPLVSVLVGGANGRFRLGAEEARGLAEGLCEMIRRDDVRVVLTPSRRTDPAAVSVLKAALEPLGGVVWGGEGDNPYVGLLACADLIVVTMDSVSMVSEAVATDAPVMVMPLPGKSRRIGMFVDILRREGRVRTFEPRMTSWRVSPLDDTAMAADEMRARLGL